MLFLSLFQYSFWLFYRTLFAGIVGGHGKKMLIADSTGKPCPLCEGRGRYHHDGTIHTTKEDNCADNGPVTICVLCNGSGVVSLNFGDLEGKK